MASDGEWGVGGKVVQMVKPAENCQFYSLVYTFPTLLKMLFTMTFVCC